jgi:hypothetical protein
MTEQMLKGAGAAIEQRYLKAGFSAQEAAHQAAAFQRWFAPVVQVGDHDPEPLTVDEYAVAESAVMAEMAASQ